MSQPETTREFYDLTGYRPDAVRGEAIFEVKERVRDLRQLKAALLQLAVALGYAPSFRGTLVLVDPEITWKRLEVQWAGLRLALNKDVLGRLCLAVRDDKGIRGMPEDPTPHERSVIDEIIEDEANQRPSSKHRPSSGAFYDVLRVLIVSWFRQEGPLTTKRICEIAGYSYPTVAHALHEVEPRLTRHSDRSVELRAFPKDDWMRFLSNSTKLRRSSYFTDRSGHPRPAEKLLDRLRKVVDSEVAVGGVLGARHYLPGLDLVGTPRLDVTLEPQSEASLMETIRRVDPGLKPARPGEPAALVVHFTRLPEPLFTRKGEKVWADEVDCLLDLHETRLESQAHELVEHLSPDH